MIREIVVAAPIVVYAIAGLALLGFLAREAFGEIRLWIAFRQCARPLTDVERVAYRNLFRPEPAAEPEDTEPEHTEPESAECLELPDGVVVIDLDALDVVAPAGGEDR